MPYFADKKEYYAHLDSQHYDPQEVSVDRLDNIEDYERPRKGLYYAELPYGRGWRVLDTTKRLPEWTKGEYSGGRYYREVYTAVCETKGDAIAWLLNRDEKTRSRDFATFRKGLIKYAMEYFDCEFQEEILLDYFYRHCLIEDCMRYYRMCGKEDVIRNINFRLDRVRRRLYGIVL